ncbi:MAG: ABC transporter ATP-binding protein/permease [Ruminococcaceae bacterium]|nr:ABC transporter ATP-binding protein/permease [Oscillospiraceae bacterium]
MIRAEGVTKKYETKSGDVVGVDQINIEIKKNGLYMILGKSGCGKTTLLNVLSGLDSYDEGHIYVNDKDMACFSEDELDRYRNINIGFIFQEFNLLPELTVYDNLRLVLEIQNCEGEKEINVKTVIEENLKRVGLEGYNQRKVFQLSGGERQRVAIARVLIKNPSIIFADEPTGNLDGHTSKAIFELLKEISKEYIVIVVTHDKEFARRYGDEVINVENGKIINSEKKQTFLKYSFTLQRASSPQKKRFDSLEHDEAFETLGREIFSENSHGDIILSEISCVADRRHDNPESEKMAKKDIKKQTKALSDHYLFSLAFQFMKTKKLPLVLTVFILSISMVLLYSSIVVTNYQRDKVIANYMEQYKIELLPLYYETSYKDSFFEIHKTQLTKGEFFNEIVNRASDGFTETIRAIYDNEVRSSVNEGEYTSISGVTSYFVCKKYAGVKLFEGRMIENCNEVVVSDYVASELNLKLGDKIEYNYGSALEIVGIAKTNYIEYDLRKKLVFGTGGEYTDYYMRYKYNVIYLHDSCLIENKKESNERLNLPMADFTLSNRELSLFKSVLYYDDASKVISEFLIDGRLPQAPNEVVVSDGFAEYSGIYDGNSPFAECEYNFFDIYQEKFNHLNSSCLNLRQYFPEGVKVVGIVSNFQSKELCSEVYVFSETMAKIKEDYYDNYAAELLFFVKNHEYKSIVESLSQCNIKIEEPSISQIYEFENILKTISPFIYLLFALVLILNVFVLINFIQNTIRGNRKNVGILRALGVSMKDTKSIFNIEFRIVFLFSSLMSIPVSSLIIAFANNLYKKDIFENPYNIISHNAIAYVIALLFCGLIGTIASSIPIRKLNKFKPIELIR